jgi:DNA-directed RNA polymerase subunit M/transcription elongation factor TFIIS
MTSALQSREQAAKVPKGETVAMVCAKCQTVLLSKVDTKKGFLGWFQPKTKHECPGCGGEFSMRDVPAGQGGKLSVSEYVHTCSKCGDDSAFCCTTQPGAVTTRGMEKKETEKK